MGWMLWRELRGFSALSHRLSFLFLSQRAPVKVCIRSPSETGSQLCYCLSLIDARARGPLGSDQMWSRAGGSLISSLTVLSYEPTVVNQSLRANSTVKHLRGFTLPQRLVSCMFVVFIGVFDKWSLSIFIAFLHLTDQNTSLPLRGCSSCNK